MADPLDELARKLTAERFTPGPDAPDYAAQRRDALNKAMASEPFQIPLWDDQGDEDPDEAEEPAEEQAEEPEAQT